MAYTVMACRVMAYTVTAYIVMAQRVMASYKVFHTIDTDNSGGMDEKELWELGHAFNPSFTE